MTVYQAKQAFNLTDQDFYEAFPLMHQRDLLTFMSVTQIKDLVREETNLKKNVWKDKQNDPYLSVLDNLTYLSRNKEYEKCVDNKTSIVHERMLDIVSLNEPGEMFQIMAHHYKGASYPIKDYKLSAYWYDHRISPQTWLKLHDPGCTDFSIRMLLPECFVDEKGNITSKATRKCKSMGVFFVSWQLLKVIKRTICALDYSMEVVDAFMAKHEYFIGNTAITGSLPVQYFCLNFVDRCLVRTAAHYKDKSGCLTKLELQQILQDCTEAAAPVKAVTTASSSTHTGSRPSNKRQNTQSSDKVEPPKKVNGYCGFYNAPSGCRAKFKEKGGCRSGNNNFFYRHKCFEKVEGDKLCNGDHPAYKHEEEMAKK